MEERIFKLNFAEFLDYIEDELRDSADLLNCNGDVETFEEADNICHARWFNSLADALEQFEKGIKECFL